MHDAGNCSALPSPGDEQYRQFFLGAQFATALIVYPLICSFGILANAVSVIVISSCKLAVPTNVFLVSLALSDTVKLANDFLYFVSILVQHTAQNPDAKAEMFASLYPYSHFVMQTSNSITVWLAVAISTERFILVAAPSRAKRLCTLRGSKLIVLTSCSLLTLLCLPHLMRYESIRCIELVANGTAQAVRHLVVETERWQASPYRKPYTWLIYGTRFLVPLAMLIGLNAFIVRALRRSRSRRRLMGRHRITIMLLTVVLVFTLSILPDAVLSTVLNYGFVEESYLVRGVREITDVFVCFNSACNFILYFTFNTIFKNQFMLLFCWRCSQKPRLRIRTASAGGSGSVSRLYVSLRTPRREPQQTGDPRLEIPLRRLLAASASAPGGTSSVQIVRTKTQRRPAGASEDTAF